MNDKYAAALSNIPAIFTLSKQLPSAEEPSDSEAAKVILAISEKLTQGAPEGIRQHRLCLSQYKLASNELTLVVDAFKSKGYTTNLVIERSPNGKRELSVSW